MYINPTGSILQELRLLSRITEALFSDSNTVAVNKGSLSLLSMLLLAMLRTYTTSKKVRITEEWAVEILRIYSMLLPNVESAINHVAFVSKLFGPASHSQSLFNRDAVRGALMNAYTALANHPSTKGKLTYSLQVLAALTAKDDTLASTRNFDTCIPAFQALALESLTSEVTVGTDEDRSIGIAWAGVLGPGNCDSSREISLCTAVIHECFRCIFTPCTSLVPLRSKWNPSNTKVNKAVRILSRSGLALLSSRKTVRTIRW
jgi:hypothetical protein